MFSPCLGLETSRCVYVKSVLQLGERRGLFCERSHYVRNHEVPLRWMMSQLKTLEITVLYLEM